MNDLCIMVAPNGARRSRRDHPTLPITANEIGATARKCFESGASAIHLHVRDPAERHSLDAGAYRAAIAAVHHACPTMVIQTTTEAAGLFCLDQQIAAVEELRPACLSFSIAELMREGESRGEKFLAWAGKLGIAIQFILYNVQEIGRFAELWRSGRLHLNDAPRLLLVVGRYSATLDSSPAEFEALHAALKSEGLNEEAMWMACAFGKGEMACLERVIECGGHARVGFENAIVDNDGNAATDNAQRVAMVAELARRHGRALTDGLGAARVLGLRGTEPLL